jgi:hypothetical protein
MSEVHKARKRQDKDKTRRRQNKPKTRYEKAKTRQRQDKNRTNPRRQQTQLHENTMARTATAAVAGKSWSFSLMKPRQD